MNLRMVCGVFVWRSLCMLTVVNAMLMSNDTAIVRSSGLFWLKPVAMVLFMLCSDVPAFEAVLCGDMWDIVCDV